MNLPLEKKKGARQTVNTDPVRVVKKSFSYVRGQKEKERNRGSEQIKPFNLAGEDAKKERLKRGGGDFQRPWLEVKRRHVRGKTTTRATRKKPRIETRQESVKEETTGLDERLPP